MSELLNLVGLSTGVALYAMLLAMVLRSGTLGGAPARLDPVLLSTAILGLVWNLCALPAYELPKVGIVGPFPWLIAIGFCALGFLPAVVVYSVLREGPRGPTGAAKRTMASAAYLVSSVAALLQIHAVWVGDEVPSTAAMRLLTYTFVALVAPLVFVTRGQAGERRALWVSALAAFAVSALHLTQLHQGEGSWLVELLGHHASVPLAFAILYQDYPFALADLFLKRALTLLLLVVTAFVAIAMFSLGSAPFDRFVRMDPRQVGALVTLWVATALVYPTLRGATAWFVDSVVLRRPDYRSLRATATRRMQVRDTAPALLDELCELLAPAMNARSVTWHEVAGATYSGQPSSPVSEPTGQTLVVTGEPTLVTIPTVDEPRYALTISQLTGGRRLLSDDVSSLETMAIAAGRRIDAIRITHERYERELREQEIAKLASQAELRALRAQINPHFLFNALTTIGYLIQTAPERAFDTLMRLTSLLRGVLRSESEFTTLGRELDIVASYLEIERARFDERLRVDIDVPLTLRSLRLPPLVLQPIVENAIKHGVGALASGGQVTIAARLRHGVDGLATLELQVIDTGAGATPQDFARRRELGVGLRNVERRLACQYGEQSALDVRTAVGRGTTVTIRMPAEVSSVLEAAGRSD
jgi:two-component system LytT family sensor kinase